MAFDHNPEEVESSDQIIQLVSFKIGDEEFGVDILSVQEIIRMHEITRVPNSPSFVEGVINLRGKVVPVVDLRNRLGYAERAHDKDTRIIVVEIEHRILGFIVDSVSEVLRIPLKTTESPPQMVGSVESEFITAVAKLENRLLILLDLARVLSKDEKSVLGG